MSLITPKIQQIHYLDEHRILKIARDPLAWKQEYTAYSLGLSCLPKLLDYEEHVSLTIERIHGVVAGQQTSPDWSALGTAYGVLHQESFSNKLSLCHKDTNPRNYLYVAEQQRYFLIDFEDSDYDTPLYDVIHVLLILASRYESDCFPIHMESFLSLYPTTELIQPKEWQSTCIRVQSLFDARRKIYNKPEHLPLPTVLQNRLLILHRF